MPKRIYNNDDERKNAFVKQRFECYERHKDIYKVVSNRCYYKKLLKLQPEREHELNIKINELTKTINDMRANYT